MKRLGCALAYLGLTLLTALQTPSSVVALPHPTPHPLTPTGPALPIVDVLTALQALPKPVTPLLPHLAALMCQDPPLVSLSPHEATLVQLPELLVKHLLQVCSWFCWLC